MAQRRTLTPGYVVVYPNREKSTSKVTKATVAFILVVSVALMLLITIGGWSKLEGLKAVNFAWCIAYLVIAYYVMFRWTRGLLPMAAALAMLLLILSLISATGISGTSWFDRAHDGFAPPQSLFGGDGLDPNMLGLLTVILAPVQLLLIICAMRGFAQAWNVELEVPTEEAKRRGFTPAGPPPPSPAAA